ncbi:MAG: putative minor capsid protein [Oscillospiraceae bacterium]
MTIKPIPDMLLGDSFTLISPVKSGGTVCTEISNVRVERVNSVADYTTTARDCTELSIWFDCSNSRPLGAEFSAGQRAEYMGEEYELTEVRVLGADRPHHIRIKARKINGEYTG